MPGDRPVCANSVTPLPFGFLWGLTTGPRRHAFGGREESEVRVYVLPVGLPWTNCTPPPKASGLVSWQHSNLCIKNKSPLLDENTQGSMLPSSHLALSVCKSHQLAPLTPSELWITTSPGPSWPWGFSVPCYTSAESFYLRNPSQISHSKCAGCFPLEHSLLQIPSNSHISVTPEPLTHGSSSDY